MLENSDMNSTAGTGINAGASGKAASSKRFNFQPESAVYRYEAPPPKPPGRFSHLMTPKPPPTTQIISVTVTKKPLPSPAPRTGPRFQFQPEPPTPTPTRRFNLPPAPPPPPTLSENLKQLRERENERQQKEQREEAERLQQERDAALLEKTRRNLGDIARRRNEEQQREWERQQPRPRRFNFINEPPSQPPPLKKKPPKGCLPIILVLIASIGIIGFIGDWFGGGLAGEWVDERDVNDLASSSAGFLHITRSGQMWTGATPEFVEAGGWQRRQVGGSYAPFERKGDIISWILNPYNDYRLDMRYKLDGGKLYMTVVADGGHPRNDSETVVYVRYKGIGWQSHHGDVRR